jgi:Tol biopolymer transport system component
VAQLTKTKAPIQNLDPAMSPNGNAIVFSRTGSHVVAGDSAQLYLLKLQSGGIGRLTKASSGHGDRGPVWSPNGSQIAFYSDRAGNQDVYILDLAGSTVQQVTSNPKSDTEPVWTNGGTSIAYVSTRTGSTELWATNLAGAGPIPSETQLTSDGRAKSHPDWANVPGPAPVPASTPPTPSTATPGK